MPRTILDGGMVRCIGCGREHGPACVVPTSEEHKELSFPFADFDTCPVCDSDIEEFSVYELSKLGLSKLRKALILAKHNPLTNTEG